MAFYDIACRVIRGNFCVRLLGESTKCLEILVYLGPMLIDHAGITHVNRGLTNRIWFSGWRLRWVTTARSSLRFLLETGCFQTSIDWKIHDNTLKYVKIHESTVNKTEEADAGIHVVLKWWLLPNKNWLKKETPVLMFLNRYLWACIPRPGRSKTNCAMMSRTNGATWAVPWCPRTRDPWDVALWMSDDSGGWKKQHYLALHFANWM